MKYFKIIKDNIIIGAVTSNNFMRYLSITDCFIRANEQVGEYITYHGQFYRSTWMQPIVKFAEYTEAIVIEITEEEYNTLVEALDINEIIVNEDIDDNPPPEEPNYVDPIEELSLEFIRDSKLNAMSYACKTAIESGFNLVIHGKNQHFSLTTQDQLNLMNLNVMAQTEELIPYHADGETCTFYTAEEIKYIVDTANKFKIYHTTYYNALKAYINALNNMEDIAAIQYGVEIPEQYQSDVLKTLEVIV